MTVEDTIEWLTIRPYYEGQLVEHRRLPARSASTRSITLDASVSSALADRGIDAPYDHQAAAIEATRRGQNVVCATPTASGKSLTYTIPAFEEALSTGGRTLYIAPMRALINDQAETMRSLSTDLPDTDIDVAVYTGETDREERWAIRRRKPDVILTTPDMLHLSLLPYADHGWGWLFRSLSYVAVDEVHEFRGVFGTHVSMVFRRLNRLCRDYGSDPQFVCCSATIGNPVEHAAAVTGQDESSFTLVDDDTSATGPQHWLLWNPPTRREDEERPGLDDDIHRSDDGRRNNDAGPDSFAFYDDPDPEAGSSSIEAFGDDLTGGDGSFTEDQSYASPYEAGGTRLSNHPQTIRLFCDLVARGNQTLVFTTARQATEQYSRWADRRLRSMGHADLADKVVAYHAALPDETRAEFEKGLDDGTIRGVWSTNALELGIDVGTLDVVLLDGHPGTVMSTFQRAGRAGRGDEPSLVTLVASPNPLDQHYMRNPTALFDSDPERATVNPRNQQLLPLHLCCAADERPLSVADEAYFGPDLADHVSALETAGKLERRLDREGTRWHYADPETDSPQYATSIRSIDDYQLDLIDSATDAKLTTLNFDEALRDAYPQAIYTQQKTTYRVTDVDYDDTVATLREIQTNGYTKPLREKEVTVHETLDSREIPAAGDGAVTVGFADMTVSEEVAGYLHFESPQDDTGTKHTYDEDEIPPKRTIRTNGLYLSISPSLETALVAATGADEELVEGLHAVEHVLSALFPLEILCARHDVGGLSIDYHSDTGRSTIFVHETHPGGVGLARAGYEEIESLLEKARGTIVDCPCTSGCPECIHSPHCGVRNADLDKQLAEVILRQLPSENS